MALKRGYILDDILDQSFIYSILCYQSYSFYNMLKYIFSLPLIITSSMMSIINSNSNQEDNHMKIINISFNIFTALMLVINSNLKFESRADAFKNTQTKFIKLQHEIEKYIVDEENPSKSFINELRDKYDNIVEGIQYEIPKHICNRVRNQYKEKRTLPIIINGIKKKEEHRDNEILDRFNSIDNNKSDSIDRVNSLNSVNVSSSFVYKKNPVVLDIKKNKYKW